jgi:hypothetical protein
MGGMTTIDHAQDHFYEPVEDDGMWMFRVFFRNGDEEITVKVSYSNYDTAGEALIACLDWLDEHGLEAEQVQEASN